MYDTIALDLQWGQNPELINLAGLDVKTAEGFTCRVPSENATYFINLKDLKTYKFTEAGSSLTCQADIGGIPHTAPTDLKTSFAFEAGSGEKQNLYFGTTSTNVIDIFQLQAGTWTKVLSHTIGDTIVQAVACTLEGDGQYHQGCILMVTTQGFMNLHLGCLLFDSDNPVLRDIRIDPSYRLFPVNMQLDSALGIQRMKLLLRIRIDSNDTNHDILQIEPNRLHRLSSSKVQALNTGIDTRSEFFSLTDTGAGFAIPIPILTMSRSSERSFYKLDSYFDCQRLDLTPPNLVHPSLVIPFVDKLYLVTTFDKQITYNGQPQEETGYYRAQF